jgi:hypothetical protein
MGIWDFTEEESEGRLTLLEHVRDCTRCSRVWRAAFDEAEDETIRLFNKGESTVKVEISDLLLDELFACSALPKETRIKALKGFGRN